MLTTKLIDALAPRGVRYGVPDAKVRGLELRVSTHGVKTWALRYRTAAGAQRRLTLGRYPELSLLEARQQAQRALREVDTGGDPQAARLAARQAVVEPTPTPEVVTVAMLAKEYLERHARPRKRSWRADERMLRREILPKWGDRAVAAITRREARRLIQAVADRGAPTYANRIAALLSRVFRFAVDDEVIAISPMVRLPKPGLEAHVRGETDRKAYDDDEVRAIWRASATLEPRAQAIIRLGLLTGQRPGEIQHARWEEFSGGWWTIPASRAKNGREHRVPLTEPARALLARVPRIIGEPHVFAGCRSKRHMEAINAIVFAGLRRREKPRHALRDTVATGLAACGVPVETIARVLNHATGPRVTAGYNAYRYDREKGDALERWADHLLALVGEAKAAPPAIVAS